MVKAACMNTVRTPEGQWIHCTWMGEIKDLAEKCPMCLNKGRLAPVKDIDPIVNPPSSGASLDVRHLDDPGADLLVFGTEEAVEHLYKRLSKYEDDRQRLLNDRQRLLKAHGDIVDLDTDRDRTGRSAYEDAYAISAAVYKEFAPAEPKPPQSASKPS